MATTLVLHDTHMAERLVADEDDVSDDRLIGHGVCELRREIGAVPGGLLPGGASMWNLHIPVYVHVHVLPVV